MKCKISFDIERIVKRQVDFVVTSEAPVEVAINAFSKGKLIFVQDKEEVKVDYFRVCREYEDSENLRRLRCLRLKRKFV